MFEELSSKWYTCNPVARSSEQCAANAAAPTLVDTNVEKNEYHNLLTEFYQKHNADKVSEVSKTLETYKVSATYYIYFATRRFPTTTSRDVFLPTQHKRGESEICSINLRKNTTQQIHWTTMLPLRYRHLPILLHHLVWETWLPRCQPPHYQRQRSYQLRHQAHHQLTLSQWAEKRRNLLSKPLRKFFLLQALHLATHLDPG